MFASRSDAFFVLLWPLSFCWQVLSRRLVPLVPCTSNPFPSFHREVDYFIEKLQQTIQFLSGLMQDPSADGNGPNDDGDDDFVPFI
jgi:hypothetical protein